MVKSLLEQAYVNSGKMADKIEQAACDFFIASSYCTLSLRDNPTMKNAETLKHHLTLAAHHQNAMIEVADLSWFVFQGDREKFHEDAAEMYFAGYFDGRLDGLTERRSTEALVKFLGSKEILKRPHEEEWKRAVYDLIPRRISHLMRNKVPMIGIHDSDWSTERWRVGRVVAANWLSEKWESEGDSETDEVERLKKYLDGALIMDHLDDAAQEKWGEGTWRCMIKYVELSRALKIPFSTEILRVMSRLSSFGRDALVRNFTSENFKSS